jgi:phage terminase large subunit-like protein
VALLERDPAQAERYFLNRKRAAADAGFDGDRWDELADREHEPDEGALLVVGVDGARFVDALAMVATEVETGYQWPLGIWERPPAAAHDYEHPLDEADAALVDVFERFEVWRVYVDPQWIDPLVDRWRGRWGDQRVYAWHTSRTRATAWAVRTYAEAFAGGDVSHSGDELLARHVKQARRRTVNVFDDEHRQLYVLAKDTPDSPRKIDGAMAAVLSWEARGDAIASGALERQPAKPPATLITF